MSFALLGALALAEKSLSIQWLTKKDDIWSSIGPKILAAALLGVLSFLLSRIRKRRKLPLTADGAMSPLRPATLLNC